MVKVNFDEIPDGGGYLLPEGDYLCTVKDIEERVTSSTGVDLWNLHLEVCDGPKAGKTIFDNLVFSPKALARVKAFCSAAGINTRGQVELVPENLMGKQVIVSVHHEEFEGRDGTMKKRNAVPWEGYTRPLGREQHSVKKRNAVPWEGYTRPLGREQHSAGGKDGKQEPTEEPPPDDIPF